MMTKKRSAKKKFEISVEPQDDIILLKKNRIVLEGLRGEGSIAE